MDVIALTTGLLYFFRSRRRINNYERDKREISPVVSPS